MHNLRYMMVFLQVVESGSISAAADYLGISKSVVSQQLKNLETSLGVSLLNRTTRSQVLTPAGRDFFRHCQKINQISEQAWNDARDSQQLAMGSITISAPSALSSIVLAPAIGHLLKQYPRIQPRLLISDTRVNLLEDGIDLAIRVGEMPDSSYKQRRLGQFQEALWAHQNYVELAQITQQRLIDDSSFRDSCDYIANQWQGRTIKHSFYSKGKKNTQEIVFHASRNADSLPTVTKLMEAGCGLAWLPEFVVKSSPVADQIIDVLPDFSSPPVKVYALHAYSGHCPHIVSLCIEAIKEQMQEMGF
ncbi:MAG: LysR family transcriptional regulator [Kangiellaceae bacterium]|nr:LysR family transcriptional regulator [Kangiellaceae bacterium]